MSVRTFTMPGSLNETLAQPNGAAVLKTFSEKDREPLASNKPEKKPGITFAGQDQLPKLPIPDLEGTCRKYLEALKPLQSRREHQDSEAAVSEFLKQDGPELQEKLKKYATGKSSYIEQFCTLRNHERRKRN
jgi:carnitine O-acetyltransferase